MDTANFRLPLIEEALHPVEPAFALRAVPRAAFKERLLELLQNLALRFGELDRRLDLHMHVKIAGDARTQTLDALAAQTERLARLRAFRHREARTAGQCGHFDLAAERRRGERNRHLAMQIVAVALEHRVLLDVNLDVQVARRTAVDAPLAVSGRADAHAVVYTGRNLHFQRLGFLQRARAWAVHTQFRNIGAGAMALRTGLLDAEETLR